MNQQDRQTLLEELAEPVCAAHGCELVEIRQIQGRGGWTIQVMIDRPRDDEREGSGVTLEECTGVSRDLSDALDVHEEQLPGKYHLEVSSPGLERPLVKLHDFERFSGKEIKLKTHVPISLEGAPKPRKSFQGKLLGVADGRLVQLDQDGVTVSIPHDSIARANLVYRF